jgi:hypothetical protein
LRTPARSPGRLGDGTKDNFNLDFVQVRITQFDDLVKSLLPEFRLGLRESRVLTLDHGTSYSPFPRPVALDTFLQGNIKQEDRAGNLKPLCQLEVFPPVGHRERRRINHTEPVQSQPQLREEVDQSEGLGLKTLIPLVVAHSTTRPVRRDDLRGTEVALGKSRLSAGRRSAEQNDRRANQPHPLLLALIWCLFLGHGSYDGSFRNLAAFRAELEP